MRAKSGKEIVAWVVRDVPQERGREPLYVALPGGGTYTKTLGYARRWAGDIQGLADAQTFVRNYAGALVVPVVKRETKPVPYPGPFGFEEATHPAKLAEALAATRAELAAAQKRADGYRRRLVRADELVASVYGALAGARNVLNPCIVFDELDRPKEP